MRIFVLAAFVLAASFGTPFFANAQTQGNSLGPTGDTSQTTGSSLGQSGNTMPSSANQNSGTNVTLLNPLKGVDCSRSNGNCLSAFLLNILDFVITIGSIVVILMLVYVGFKFVTAQGKPGDIDAAKQMLLWTIIGALILLGSKAIAEGVKATVSALGG